MKPQSLPIVIRPIRDEDLPGVLLVYRESQDFLALGPDPIASEGMLRRDIEISRSEGGIFCGIFDPIGTIVGVLDYIPANYGGCPGQAFISLLMIGEPYRRRGIGRRALAQVEAEVQKGGHVTTILTAVQINNPQAQRFWQKNGYFHYVAVGNQSSTFFVLILAFVLLIALLKSEERYRKLIISMYQ